MENPIKSEDHRRKFESLINDMYAGYDIFKPEHKGMVNHVFITVLNMYGYTKQQIFDAFVYYKLNVSDFEYNYDRVILAQHELPYFMGMLWIAVFNNAGNQRFRPKKEFDGKFDKIYSN